MTGWCYLADAGQFGEQHLEDGRRQSLLQHLQQLLRLTTHCDGVGQVVHTFLIVSCGAHGWRSFLEQSPVYGHETVLACKAGVGVCRCYPEPAAPPPAGSPPGRTSAPPRRPSGPGAAGQTTVRPEERFFHPDLTGVVIPWTAVCAGILEGRFKTF